MISLSKNTPLVVLRKPKEIILNGRTWLTRYRIVYVSAIIITIIIITSEDNVTGEEVIHLLREELSLSVRAGFQTFRYAHAYRTYNILDVSELHAFSLFFNSDSRQYFRFNPTFNNLKLVYDNTKMKNSGRERCEI